MTWAPLHDMQCIIFEYQNWSVRHLVSPVPEWKEVPMPEPVPECSGTGLRLGMPECLYWRHRPRCQGPTMEITQSVSSNIGHLHYKAPVTFKALLEFCFSIRNFLAYVCSCSISDVPIDEMYLTQSVPQSAKLSLQSSEMGPIPPPHPLESVPSPLGSRGHTR